MSKRMIALCCAVLMLALPAPGMASGYAGEAPIAQEKVQISILTSNHASLQLGFNEMLWWKSVLDKANVELIVEEIDPSSYNDVVKPRLAAGINLPDIVKLPSRDDDMAYINSGLFLELGSYIDTLGFNLKKAFDANPGLKAEVTTPDGGIFYIPYIVTHRYNTRSLFLNFGFVEKLGIDPNSILTLDDYYNYLVAVKENDLNGDGSPNDEVPLFMRSGQIQLWGIAFGLDLDSGGYQVDADGKVFYGFADSRYKTFLETMNKWYTEGLLYNEFPTANFDVQTALYTNNQVGSVIHFMSNLSSYSQAIDPNWNFKTDAPIIQAIIPPKGPYGDQYVLGRDPLGGLFGITKFAKDPESVFAFIDYLYSDEVANQVWFGNEGVDYNIVDGDFEFTDLYLNNQDNYLRGMGLNVDALPGQQGNGYMAQEPKAVRDVYEQLSDYALQPSIRFSYKLPEENEILRAYGADLSTYVQENLISFIIGTRSLDDWDAYISGLEAMSLSEVLSVYQAAADRASSAE